MPARFRELVDMYLISPAGFLFMFWGLGWLLFMVTGNALIDWLKQRKGMKWAPREDTPDSHLQKAGTPSMGGIGIIGAALLGYLGALFFVIGASMLRRGPGLDPGVLGLLNFPALVLLHCILGYVDDHSKATNRGGLSSKAKLLGQIVLAAGFLSLLFLFRDEISRGMGPFLDPGLKGSLLGSFWVFGLAFLIIIGTSNAVNLTDGIDGLVAGLSVQVGLVFSVFLFSGFRTLDNASAASVLLLWMALGGACLGFLAFNKYPAKVFMGDTGSLALGAALGAGAILTRSVLLLPFIGFIFFVEMFSVIFQVAYFKYTKKKTGEGKRIFRRAPLHHHFELGGWSEWRVVGTFWLINLVTSAIGLTLWKMGILPRFP